MSEEHEQRIYDRCLARVGQLEAENAKLRTLLHAMWVRIKSEHPHGGFPDMGVFEDELQYQGIKVDA